MSSTANTFESLVGTVMRTPISAITQAEREYLQIWLSRLRAVQQLNLGSTDQIKAFLDFAPVMKLTGDVQVAATVRLTSVRQSTGGIELTIGTGPIGIGGSFGFLNRSSEESVIQISANFKLTNGETSLLDYLRSTGQLEIARPSDVSDAIAHLEKAIGLTIPKPVLPAPNN